MSQLDLEAVNPIAARMGKIRAIAVTTTSARHNLAALAEFGTGGDDMARVFRLRADGGDVYYFFNNADAGTVDQEEVAAGDADQCDVIPSGTFIDVRMPWVKIGGGATAGLATWLVVKGSVVCTLRISISSEEPGKRY